jgi:polyphosphate kinase
VGRFLEHSRIFAFENGGAREVYLSSADLRERNLNRRVEILWPVRDGTLARYLRDVVLDGYLRDTRRARALRADGEYEPLHPAAEVRPFDSQHWLTSHMPPHAGSDDGALEPDVPSVSDAETADAEI